MSRRVFSSALLSKPALLTGIFFILSLFGILHHEIWLDEAQHFLIARDSRSVQELFLQSRNEGHPLVWNILLFFCTRISDQVIYMQCVHILIATGAVYIIATGDLRWYEKIMLICSYFILYEYNFISRNYGLCVLFFFLLIRQYQKNKEAVITLACLVILLANCHLFALILSAAFVLTYMLRERILLSTLQRRKRISALLMLCIGWSIAIFCIIPPHGYGNTFLEYENSGYFSNTRLIKTLSVSLKGIFYLPDFGAEAHRVENSYYFENFNIPVWGMYVLSLITLILPAWVLWKHKFARTLYLTFLLLFLPVYYFLPLVNGVRYYGFLFILFAACYQLGRAQFGKIAVIFTACIFAVQAFGGIYVAMLDYLYPFSASKAVSTYIKEQQKADEPILILDRTLRPAISAYTGEKYFGVETGDSLSYCLWNKHMPDDALHTRLQEIAAAHPSVLIVSKNLPSVFFDTSHVVQLKTFDQGMVPVENAIVYRYGK